MTLSPRDELSYWRTLADCPGWKLLQEKVRDLIFLGVGTQHEKVLEGMKRAIRLPDERIASLEETIKRAIDESGPAAQADPAITGRKFYG